MGDVLDYERGKLCIGRMVRVLKYDGGQHAQTGKLVEAQRKHAVIRFFGHTRNSEIEWRHVHDWPTRNGGPAPMPSPSPAPPPRPPTVRIQPPNAEEHAQMNNHVIQQTAAKAANLLRSSLTDSDMLDLNDLPAKIKAGVADVEAARAQVKEAQAVLAEREKSLRDLREAARNALARIDAALAPAGGS